MESLQFISTTPEKLVNLISEGVRLELQQLRKELLHENVSDELLTREDTCELLSINPSTLWAWTNKGVIKAYGISGSRRYYKRSEIMKALKQLKK